MKYGGTLLMVLFLVGCGTRPSNPLVGRCWKLDSFDGRKSNVIYCFDESSYSEFGRSLDGNVRPLGYDDVVEDRRFWLRRDSIYFEGLRFSIIELSAGKMSLQDEVGRMWKLTETSSPMDSVASSP